MTEVDIEATKLVKYLKIAENQRNRALQKFVQDYGPSSATVTECTKEVADLRLAINKLEASPTPIEDAIQKKGGR